MLKMKVKDQTAAYTPSSFRYEHFEDNKNVSQKWEPDNICTTILQMHKKNLTATPKDLSSHTNREVMSTFLTTENQNVDCVLLEKLIQAGINFYDLSSLSDKDLQLIGRKDKKDRNELLQFFAGLSHQEENFQNVCNSALAKEYNDRIMYGITKHFNLMTFSLNSANYKLKTDDLNDIILGEKYFASHFLIESLAELERATKDIETDLNNLQELLNGSGTDGDGDVTAANTSLKNGKKQTVKNKKGKILNGTWFMVGTLSLSVTVMAALWYFNIKKLNFFKIK